MNILSQIFENGGVMGWLLLILWILSSAVILERTTYWIIIRIKRKPLRYTGIIKSVNGERYEEAYDLAAESSDIFSRVFMYLLPDIPPMQEMEDVIVLAVDKEFNRSHSFLRILNACAVIAPALGLLGTVMGLTRAFGTMSESVDMSLIAKGISEAMVTTFVGLAVAVVNLAASHFFSGIADKALSNVEMNMTEFKLAATNLKS